MNSSGGIISGNNTPMNMYTYGNLNGVGPNDLPDVNFQEVADYFNLSSPLLSMSSLVGGQSTGSAKGKAKFTFDDFDVQSSTKNNKSSYGNNNNNKGSKMKELPPSARFAKEMWGRKR